MTYSIVARDETGAIGVAIQSHFFAVGDGAPWIQAGAGAVCTQAFIARWYGPIGLAKLAEGHSPRDTIDELVAADPGHERRQVAVVGVNGDVAAYTGARCLGEAGHATAEGAATQANMVSSPRVWRSMLAVFEDERGALADRLVSALEAGESAGGDRRGRQSAALTLVHGDGGGFSLRVDDDPDPLAELRRLLDLRRAYDAIGRGLETALLAQPNASQLDTALKGLDGAAELLGEKNPEAIFWRGVLLARVGRTAEAKADFAKAAAAGHDWSGLVKDLPSTGLLPHEDWVQRELG